MAGGGLIQCFRVGADGRPEEGGWEGLRAGPPAGGFLWAHLDAGSDDARAWLHGELPEAAAEALLVEDTRPRAVGHPDGLQLNLRGVNTNPGAEPDDMVSLRIWVEDTRILTVRVRRVMAAEDVAGQLRAGEGPRSPGGLLVALAERLEVRIDDAVSDLAEHLDAFEERQALEGADPAKGPELAEIRRQSVVLRRYLAPQRVALEDVARGRLGNLSPEQAADLREVVDRTVRHLEDLEAIRERAAVAQEEQSQHLAAELNRRIYALSIVAGLFLPLTFLTGLLGINVAGIPGADSPVGFAVVSGLLAAVVGFEVLLFRRLRWM